MLDGDAFVRYFMKKVKILAALLVAVPFLSSIFSCANAQNPSSDALVGIDSSSTSSWESNEPDSSTNDSDSSAEDSSSSSVEEKPPIKDSSVIETPSTNTSTQTKNAQYILCTGDNVNLRSGAGTNYTVLGNAEKGTVYAVIEKTGNWYKTYYRNKIAYIYASYANVFTLEKTKNDAVEDVVEEGYKLIGTPYVYGAVRLHDGKGRLLAGFSAQKFDCSSLVQYIFYHGADTMLNMNTRTQVKQGSFVKKSELKRGDCIFFTNEDRQYNTGIERVGHVALYLGNNYILHTASDYARIEKISAKRWSFYIEARRFV